MKYIKIHIEMVLPVPDEVTDDLDTVAEFGLSTIKDHIGRIIPNHIPGTLTSSWQSMPQEWHPPRSAREIILQEEVAPGFHHVVDSEERVVLLEPGEVEHPWDQGLWIFPEGSPLRGTEARFRELYLRDDYPESHKEGLKQSLKELTEGEDDDA